MVGWMVVNLAARTVEWSVWKLAEWKEWRWAANWVELKAYCLVVLWVAWTVELRVLNLGV